MWEQRHEQMWKVKPNTPEPDEWGPPLVCCHCLEKKEGTKGHWERRVFKCPPSCPETLLKAVLKVEE